MGKAVRVTRAFQLAVALMSAVTIAGAGRAQQPPATAPAPVTPSTAAASPAPQPAIEPAAVAILKAMSEKLATAKTISFTAVSTYESPAINGQPLYYTTTSQGDGAAPRQVAGDNFGRRAADRVLL